jgi:hypothetical protein
MQRALAAHVQLEVDLASGLAGKLMTAGTIPMWRPLTSNA